MDYGTLAQLSSPGQTPLTSGIVDPLGYQLWLNKANMQQEALRNSLPLAAQAAEREQQAHREYMAGTPGREDTVRLNNMNAATAVQMQPDKAVYDKLRLANMTDDEKKKAASILSPLNEFADAYDAAQTPADKQKVIAAMKAQNVRLPNGYQMGTNPETDDYLLYTARQVRENAPALSIKRDVAAANWAGKIAQTNLANASRERIAQLLEEGRNNRAKAANEIRQALQAGKPMNLSQAAAAYVEAMYGNDLEGALAAIRAIQSGGAGISAQQKLDIMSKMGMDMPTQAEGPAIPPSNRTGPGPVTATKTTQPTAKPQEPKIGDMWQTATGKQPIKDIGRDKTGKIIKLRLEDGTVIDYK